MNLNLLFRIFYRGHLVSRCIFVSFAFLDHMYIFLWLLYQCFMFFFHLQSDESLVLYHFQYHGWKENGLTRAESLVYLQQQVHKVEPGEHRGPIIVHCRYRSNVEPSLRVKDSRQAVRRRSVKWAARLKTTFPRSWACHAIVTPHEIGNIEDHT